MTTTTGHTITVDTATDRLTISGPTETMDAIPDVEIDAAAAAQGRLVDWTRGPLDETTYALVYATLDDQLEDVARTHLKTIGWRTEDGISDKALGFGGDFEPKPDRIQPQAWRDLCESAVIRVAKDEIVRVCDR